MSTRCVIHFVDTDADKAATIYRHSDGYPDTEHGVLADLETFFGEVVKQTRDTRFSDPSYLAAKFVVWSALQNPRGGGPLDFLGVGIMIDSPQWIDYEYSVHCMPSGEKPKVTYVTR